MNDIILKIKQRNSKSDAYIGGFIFLGFSLIFFCNVLFPAIILFGNIIDKILSVFGGIMMFLLSVSSFKDRNKITEKTIKCESFEVEK